MVFILNNKGTGLMMSTFVFHKFGLGMYISSSYLDRINTLSKSKKYIDKSTAMKVSESS